jgi:AcrR family transcriptional regulator
MQTFWAKGYEAKSLNGLCAATGFGHSSLYAAFGDKQGLYLALWNATIRGYRENIYVDRQIRRQPCSRMNSALGQCGAHRGN